MYIILGYFGEAFSYWLSEGHGSVELETYMRWGLKKEELLWFENGRGSLREGERQRGGKWASRICKVGKEMLLYY